MDRALHGVGFRPRASLGPEVLGRVRRGERSEEAARPGRGRRGLAAAVAAAVLTLAAGAAVLTGTRDVVAVDRCCYDLDGGGNADDGVLVNGERDARIHQLRIYEDRDHSGSYSAADVVRLDRGDSPAMYQALAGGLVTIERCCLDFDGGGPADDGLLVLGVPPDRVVMAAIYERPADAGGRRVRSGGFALR